MAKDVAKSTAKDAAKDAAKDVAKDAAKDAFRPMRRRRQEMDLDQTLQLLRAGEYGVLALASPDEAFPYAVPISYAVLEGSAPEAEAAAPDGEAAAPVCTLVMHCALEGHKLDLIAQSPQACFTVVGHSEVAPEKLTAIYQSAMAFGTVRVVEDAEERAAAFAALGAKYCPGLDEFVAEEAARFDARTTILALDVAHLSGKQAKELV